jgi:hypothetical protein
MSASTAIGLVSNSLRNLLLGEMSLGLTVDVTVLGPDEAGGDRRVNLFLYRIEENPFLRNQDAAVRPGTPGQLTPPPLSLSLYYLVTAYAPNDAQTGNSTAQQLLGEAMRVFFDHGVIPTRYLDPGLEDAREQLQVVNKSWDPEELSRIWTTFGHPYRLSVLYQVSTVQLDAKPVAPVPAPKRVQRGGVPAVRQPLDRPAVLGVAPRSVPAGTAVVLTGEHLTGWQGSVSMGALPLLARTELTSDAITVNVPATTEPGVYDLQVDVAGLFRRTFALEVTP